MLEAPLPQKVKQDDSYWTLDDDAYAAGASSMGDDEGAPAMKTLTIYLTKQDDMSWWDRVAEGEPHIDITKVSL